jgi:hypothetical protein
VLLLHGFFASRRTFDILEARLRRDGYGVFSLHLGGFGGTFNTRSVDDVADLVRAKLERIYARNPGMGPLTIVGHSKGGLVAAYYVKRLGGWRRTRAVVTLGTPHHGTPLAYLGLPLGGVSRSVWQMMPGSAFLQRLHDGPWPAQVRLASIWSRRDGWAPYPSAVLETHDLPHLVNVGSAGTTAASSRASASTRRSSARSGPARTRRRSCAASSPRCGAGARRTTARARPPAPARPDGRERHEGAALGPGARARYTRAVRDRRWDHLYDRERQPVKAYVLERFAGELARELEAWPPPFVEWVSDELRARWAAGAAERPRDDVVRFALEIARLDLQRDFEAVERQLAAGAHRLQTPAEAAALHLLVRLVTEKCLGL